MRERLGFLGALRDVVGIFEKNNVSVYAK